jgi:hypothetical protein
MSIYKPITIPNTIGKPYKAQANTQAQKLAIPNSIGLPLRNALAKAQANKNAKAKAQQHKLTALQNLTAKNRNPYPKNSTLQPQQNNASTFTRDTFTQYAKNNLGQFVNMVDCVSNSDPRSSNSCTAVQKIERDGDAIIAKLGIFKTKDYTNNFLAKKAFNIKIEDNGKQYALEHIVIDPTTAVFTFKSDDKIKFILTKTNNRNEMYTVTSDVMERKKGWFLGGTRKQRKNRNKRTRRN